MRIIFFNPHTPVGTYYPHLERKRRFREQNNLFKATEPVFFTAMP